MSINPYAALGLRCNPFITEVKAGVPSRLWVDRGFSKPPPISAKLLVQVMGEMGAGKTSHLLHWQKQTGGVYYSYLKNESRWVFPPVEAIAYWDEANRIPPPLLPLAFWQASRTGATIVMGTHTNFSLIARLVGLKVQTIYLPTLEINTLLTWATLRIEAVRLPGAAIDLTLTREQAAKIVALSGASWRKAATHLHIWVAKNIT